MRKSKVIGDFLFKYVNVIERANLSLALRMDLSFPGIENLRVAIVIVARGDLCRNGGVWHCQTHPYIWPSP